VPRQNALQTRFGLTRVDLDIDDGRIRAVHPTETAPETTAPVVDLDNSQVWPGFVDLHTHLDKGHIWPRRENLDGTFMGARQAIRDERRYWSATDVAVRMDFSLRCAYAHGTVALRTHLDSLSPQHRISWPVFAEIRAIWADRIELQAVSLVPIEVMEGPLAEELADLVADHRGVLGAITYMTPNLAHQLERVFRLAMERGLELDFHVDESLDPDARSLLAIAETALRLEFSGRLVVGHCCSLSIQPAAIIDMTLEKVQQAGIAVVSLPMCNLYLQDRVPGRTPRQRGVTLLHELQARGIAVAVASDNVRDPFYGYGDLDMLEVFTQATRIAHLDRPVDPWPAAITCTPARLMGCDGGVIKPGALADLVICEGRSFDEVLSRPQARRVVLRRGAPIDTVPPDYRELDHLFGAYGVKCS
jgi:cytosine deaminase